MTNYIIVRWFKEIIQLIIFKNDTHDRIKIKKLNQVLCKTLKTKIKLNRYKTVRL